MKKSRKQIRKEEKKLKKARKNDYFSKKSKLNVVKQKLRKSDTEFQLTKPINSLFKQSIEVNNVAKKEESLQKLHKQMQTQRKKSLKRANVTEDQTIKQLEKRLKINKNKSKQIPKSFSKDGLDYLLEVCDPDNLKEISAVDRDINDVDKDFDEDFALMSNKRINKKNLSESDQSNESDSAEEKLAEENTQNDSSSILSNEDYSDSNSISDLESLNNDESEGNENEMEVCGDYNTEKIDNSDENSSDDGTWEDIYGRIRKKDGSIVTEKCGKYIPPAARVQENKSLGKNMEVLKRLKRQLKGLINRLAESNMHKVAVEVEQIYMTNTRNDVNQTLKDLIFEALLLPVLSPERFIIEHMMLIAILHANVGVEVGAHFLQSLVEKFDTVFHTNSRTEDKTLDNVVLALSYLYNFKVFDAVLLYQVIEKLSERFNAKDIECLILILRAVGFTLRKDDPAKLKVLVLNVQKQAINMSTKTDEARTIFMLEILMAIKNNNVTKIPNYDVSYVDHLKKLLKTFVRKGLYVSTLNISLNDLLSAGVKGKWWIVGSAWSGKDEQSLSSIQNKKNMMFSQKLLELAKKQRMNTDDRKNIFCIIMSAEDYLDAFEKLLHLGLKNQQEREIINVLLHCCLQEKTFNPYYAHLALKFCDHDRKFQMNIKYSIWDKLKAISNYSGSQLSNLSKLLSYLILEKGLSISVLKVMHFSELDKTTLRFMRQILLAILLHSDVEQCQQVFEKISVNEKLKMFRESLRLFIKHFLLRNLEKNSMSEDNKIVLQKRCNLIDKMLRIHENKVRF